MAILFSHRNPHSVSPSDSPKPSPWTSVNGDGAPRTHGIRITAFSGEGEDAGIQAADSVSADGRGFIAD